MSLFCNKTLYEINAVYNWKKVPNLLLPSRFKHKTILWLSNNTSWYIKFILNGRRIGSMEDINAQSGNFGLTGYLQIGRIEMRLRFVIRRWGRLVLRPSSSKIVPVLRFSRRGLRSFVKIVPRRKAAKFLRLPLITFQVYNNHHI